MIPLNYYLFVSAVLFCIGVFGMLSNRRNIITLLMALELILLAVNTNFIALSNFFHDLQGQIFVFFVLVIAAAEAAIGLALLVLLYRRKGSCDAQQITTLRG